MATNIERNIHTFDATGKKVGRIATEIATLLMGKHKPSYVPNRDMGDIVDVENVANLSIAKSKLEQKKYYSYSGYQGGLKEITLEKLFAKDPAEVLRKAVFQMLPDNKLRNDRMKRLRIK
jgi:large subunit ribosomal protein L13